MKMSKTFIGVFFLTFIVGLISVTRETKVPPPMTRQIAPDEVKTIQPAEAPIALETIEEIEEYYEKYPYKIRLLTVGKGFHGEEVEARNGETWLGLFNENGKYKLRSSKIQIRPAKDDYLDGKNKKTGKDVDVRGATKPIFLLKNAGNLKEGEINTLFQGLTWKDYLNRHKESDLTADKVITYLRKGFFKQYEIGGKIYELKVIEANNRKGSPIWVLILESEGIRQILHTLKVTDYDLDVATLYWVGDLDRDGKPDFYLDLFFHYNFSSRDLFLSSEAEKGKLVKKVANFTTSGC